MNAIHRVGIASNAYVPVPGKSITNDSIFQEAIGVSRLDPNDPTERILREMALGYHARAEAQRNLTRMFRSAFLG